MNNSRNNELSYEFILLNLIYQTELQIESKEGITELVLNDKTILECNLKWYMFI